MFPSLPDVCYPSMPGAEKLLTASHDPFIEPSFNQRSIYRED
jgi:hypothetical protein